LGVIIIIIITGHHIIREVNKVSRKSPACAPGLIGMQETGRRSYPSVSFQRKFLHNWPLEFGDRHRQNVESCRFIFSDLPFVETSEKPKHF
jgi:hypothetical protein